MSREVRRRIEARVKRIERIVLLADPERYPSRQIRNELSNLAALIERNSDTLRASGLDGWAQQELRRLKNSLRPLRGSDASTLSQRSPVASLPPPSPPRLVVEESPVEIPQATEELIVTQDPDEWMQNFELDQIGRDHKMKLNLIPFPVEQFEALGFANASMGRTLGDGAFGTVVEIKATQNNVDVQLACKIIAFPDVEPTNREEFIREINYMLADARTLARLDHPNIVKTEGVIQVADRDTGFPCSRIMILMELCDGHLQYLVDRNFKAGMTEEQHKRWFRQIASALDYMHNQAMVVHLDIKPDNIMFVYGPDGKYQPLKDSMPEMTYKLTDFGTALQIEGDKQQVRPYTGTEGFRAPELETDDWSPIDPRKCDIYSLAHVIWDFCTNPEWCSNPRLNENDLTAALSPQFKEVIGAMHNDDPNSRPTIDQVINSSWLQI